MRDEVMGFSTGARLGRAALAAMLVLFVAGAAGGGPPTTAPSADGDEPPATPKLEPGKFFSPFPLKDYSGDWLTRPSLTGDWGGVRNQLAADGITFEIDVNQILQTLARGGKDTTNATRYSGSAEYTLQIDTGRAGLWPGGQFTLRGRTKFGNGINSKVGASVNFDALLPLPFDDCITTFSEFYLLQGLSKEVTLLLGKINGADFADKNEFASDEKTQFLNSAFRSNPVVLPHGPYTILAAGVLLQPTEWLNAFVAVWDTNGSAITTGFNTAFHSPTGTSLASELDIKIHPFGLEGTQRFGLIYSRKAFTVLNQGLDAIQIIPGEGLVLNLDTRPDDWCLYYNFDQYLYTEADDPKQGVGVFGRFGWTTGEANPFQQFYSLGLGGKGILSGRDNDRFGLGYFCLNFSDDIPKLFNVNSTQGVELFYNIQITPWLTVTPDLQVLHDPGGNNDRNTAIVGGIRIHMYF